MIVVSWSRMDENAKELLGDEDDFKWILIFQLENRKYVMVGNLILKKKKSQKLLVSFQDSLKFFIVLMEFVDISFVYRVLEFVIHLSAVFLASL